MIPRVISVLLVPAMLSSGLALAPSPVAARRSAPPEDEGQAAVEGEGELAPEAVEDEFSEPSEIEEAKGLFDEGAAKFETADYAGAIELWTRAYAIVPYAPQYASIKAKLIANLAEAQTRAYKVDAEVEHLNQAKILLVSYEAAVGEIYPSAAERDKELAWISARKSEIDAELQALAEREAAASAPPPKTGKGMRSGGAVLVGLGGGLLGMMVGGMVLGGANNNIDDLPSNDLDARASRYAEGRLGNTLAIVGGVGGAVMLGAGAALLVLGIRRKRALGEGEGQATALQITPTLAPTQLGLGVRGRF